MRSGRTRASATNIPPPAKVIGTGPLKCRERLGGVLTFYYREVA